MSCLHRPCRPHPRAALDLGVFRFFYAGKVPGATINTRNMAKALGTFSTGAPGIMRSGLGALTTELRAGGSLGVPWRPHGVDHPAAPNSPVRGEWRVCFPLRQVGKRSELALRPFVPAWGGPRLRSPSVEKVLFRWAPAPAAQQAAADAGAEAAAAADAASINLHVAAAAAAASSEGAAALEAAEAAHAAAVEEAAEAAEVAEVTLAAAGAAEARDGAGRPLPTLSSPFLHGSP